MSGELVRWFLLLAYGAIQWFPCSIALGTVPRVDHKRLEIIKVRIAPNASFALLATAMEFAFQFTSSCTEVCNSFPLLARRTLERPLLWCTRVAHKVSVAVAPLAHIAHWLGLATHAARRVEKGRMQDTGRADV